MQAVKRFDPDSMGIAPLTSMFWYAEDGREKIGRLGGPRSTYSDGLAIWNGAGGQRMPRPACRQSDP